jgi:hypothetical protein
MPKPIAVDNGNGMHVHQSITKDGKNLFDGDEYGKLSQMALYELQTLGIDAFSFSLNSYKSSSPGLPGSILFLIPSRPAMSIAENARYGLAVMVS